MKSALNAWSCPKDQDFKGMFAALKKAGFDGVELNIDMPGRSAHSLTLDTSKDQLKEIKAVIEDIGLPVSGISTSLFQSETLGSNRPEDRDFTRRLLETQLGFADYLEADGILIVPGGITENRSIRQAWDNCQESLLSLKNVIAGGKAFVGIENVWNNFFLSPMLMAQFIDELNIPHLGAYFDVGNVAIFSWPEYWIEILGKRIVKIHVKDFKKSTTNAGSFVNLLEGSIRWDKVMAALRKIGYDGYLTAELAPMPNTPEYLYQITQSALQTIQSL